MILSFDTSAAQCAAALLSGGALVASATHEMARGQAEALFPLLNELLDRHDATWADLTALAVGTGPGNFTGIRIAVAAARGLSMSLGIPAIGVTGFEALAQGSIGPSWATIPAPRDRVYLQRISPNDRGEAMLVTLDHAWERINADPLTVLGCLADPPAPAPDPEAIARWAEARVSALPDTSRPTPFYLRAPDAAPSRDPAPVILS